MRVALSSVVSKRRRDVRVESSDGLRVRAAFKPSLRVSGRASLVRHVHRGVVALVVSLPDCALVIPEWMTRPEAAALSLRSPAAIPEMGWEEAGKSTAPPE
jgi:hypothetical protein